MSAWPVIQPNPFHAVKYFLQRNKRDFKLGNQFSVHGLSHHFKLK